MSTTITLPRVIVERIRREAERLGLSLDEYLVELLSQNLDPRDRAREYAGAARELLEQARRELEKGNVRQAAEKAWGAATLAVKAYAYWKEQRRLSSHEELWEYARRIKRRLGSWVSDAWAQAISMHICFYEGWCTAEDVEEALKRIEKLVKETESHITENQANHTLEKQLKEEPPPPLATTKSKASGHTETVVTNYA